MSPALSTSTSTGLSTAHKQHRQPVHRPEHDEQQRDELSTSTSTGLSTATSSIDSLFYVDLDGAEHRDQQLSAARRPV